MTEGYALPLQLWALEVENNADLHAGDAKVIDDLCLLKPGNLIDAFDFHNDLVECDQIGNIMADTHALVDNIKWRLADERNRPRSEFVGREERVAN